TSAAGRAGSTLWAATRHGATGPAAPPAVPPTLAVSASATRKTAWRFGIRTIIGVDPSRFKPARPRPTAAGAVEVLVAEWCAREEPGPGVQDNRGSDHDGDRVHHRCSSHLRPILESAAAANAVFRQTVRELRP